jgi:DNA modification methylase
MMDINKIYLGDSYALIKELPAKSIDCIYTDIPYLYSGGGDTNGTGGSRVTKSIRKVAKDLVDIKDGIDYAIFDEFIRVSKKLNLFIWCSKMQLLDIMDYFISRGCNYDLLVWLKTNPIPATNNTWLPDIEYCLYFREVGVPLNDGFELKSKWYISPINQGDKDEFGHPTIKPLELVERHLLHATQPGDLVLDCFNGSGTTCVAAKRNGRNFIGMEIDPAYHKISMDRINGINARGQTSIFTDFEILGMEEL